ncbi:MAG: hypothetical protein K0S08_1218 [Gammaproteobacteria bacterium]|jgi:hypothetical protein|nr:hypothetical protein [Gammaproteobacteria bacterium]
MQNPTNAINIAAQVREKIQTLLQADDRQKPHLKLAVLALRCLDKVNMVESMSLESADPSAGAGAAPPSVVL